MKRFVFVLGVLILVGAGCSSSANPTENQSLTKESNTTETIIEDTAIEVRGQEMSAGNFFFEPSTLTASPGETVEITFTQNDGFHTFAIDEIGLDELVETGKTISFVAPLTPGEYPFYCSVGSHRDLGQEGVLIVK